MTGRSDTSKASATKLFLDAATCADLSKTRCKTRRKARRSDLSPVTLRLTAEERARLEDLAAGMTLSAYIRACVFAEESKRQKRRPRSVVADKKLAAEALGLLGQSRIASNLNQLAHHANLGILIVGETERAEISEANAHLQAIRSLLMAALGKVGGSGKAVHDP